MTSASSNTMPDEEPPDIYYCAIHGEKFSMSDDGGCPNCMEEWSSVDPDDKGDAEDGEPDAG